MINYHKEVVKALSTILPTHYEMILTSGTATPCISYMELTNVDAETGSNIGYSKIIYQIKVWGTEIETLQQYALEVDKALRALGFKRISSAELYDRHSTMMQKVFCYEAKAIETY